MSKKNYLEQKFKDNKFGRLIGLSEFGTNERNQSLWIFHCDCGEFTVKNVTKVIQGHVKSCGCLERENRIIQNKKRGRPEREATIRRLLLTYQKGARIRNLSFNLTEEEFINLIFQNCYYCGIPPSRLACRYGSKCKEDNSIYVNGVDRKDNTLGYTLDNSVPCCGDCNIFKSDYNYNEFINRITRIYNHLIKDIDND